MPIDADKEQIPIKYQRGASKIYEKLRSFNTREDAVNAIKAMKIWSRKTSHASKQGKNHIFNLKNIEQI
jgi:hypothetical protein